MTPDRIEIYIRALIETMYPLIWILSISYAITNFLDFFCQLDRKQFYQLWGRLCVLVSISTLALVTCYPPDSSWGHVMAQLISHFITMPLR